MTLSVAQMWEIAGWDVLCWIVLASFVYINALI